MGKLSNRAKGTLAVKPVSIRLARLAAQPGQAPSGDPAEFKLGLRVLTGAETLDVYEKAMAASEKRGVKWDEDHPICSLYVMAFRLMTAAVDVDDDSGLPVDPQHLSPCFASAEEILESPLLGTENIIWLNQLWQDWQDANSPLMRKFSFEEAMGFVIQDMQRKDGDEGPLVGLPRATLVSCVRTMGAMLLSSPIFKSASGGVEDTTSSGTKQSDRSDTEKTTRNSEN